MQTGQLSRLARFFTPQRFAEAESAGADCGGCTE
jgi:hypothetical protein